MARVLILSSWVAHGHVGLSAGAPALQALGHGVTELPTVMLSNHPGWPHVSGDAVECACLQGMIDALDANGWLAQVDTVQTGYLPTEDHVGLACGLIDRLRPSRGGTRLVVDPVLGDHPKGLYLPEAVAVALRDRLVPRADVLTPNRFELGWLSGQPVASLAEARRAAETLAGQVGEVLVTSPPLGEGETGLLAVTADTARLWRTARFDAIPNGTGDVFAALVAAGLAPAAAMGQLSALVRASRSAPHLRIAEAAGDWTRAHPLEPET